MHIKISYVLFLLMTCVHSFTVNIEEKVVGCTVVIKMYGVDGNTIGKISYTKIPMFAWYAVHSLYVYPEYRGKGYGTALLEWTCLSLQNLKATCAYVQPGPYELKHGKPVSVGTLYESKMEKLIHLYKKLGFHQVNQVTAKIASLFYALTGIHEDSRRLMIKNF